MVGRGLFVVSVLFAWVGVVGGGQAAGVEKCGAPPLYSIKLTCGGDMGRPTPKGGPPPYW